MDEIARLTASCEAHERELRVSQVCPLIEHVFPAL
jgi:hypothetical protein